MTDHKLVLVDGVEGPSVYLDDHRIAGPKPWGGGTVVREWTVTERDLRAALKDDTP